MKLTKEDNKKVLADAAKIQNQTLEALARMKQKTALAESVGSTTVTKMQENRETMGNVIEAEDRLNDQLEKTERLQNSLSRWALSFNNKRSASREVNQQARRKKQVDERASKIRALVDIQETPDKSNDSKKKQRSLLSLKKKKTAPSKPTLSDWQQGSSLWSSVSVKGQNNEYEKELNTLAETDAVIDQHIDDLALQLDKLVEHSMNIQEENRKQKGLHSEMNRRVQEADQGQSVANSRARRFMTGKLRKEHDKKFALFEL